MPFTRTKKEQNHTQTPHHSISRKARPRSPPSQSGIGHVIVFVVVVGIVVVLLLLLLQRPGGGTAPDLRMGLAGD